MIVVLHYSNCFFLVMCDCLHLTSFVQHHKQIDELDIWGRQLDAQDVKDFCDKIFYQGYLIKEKVKATLWKNILGVYHPLMASQPDRQAYFTKLRRVYEKLKKKWSDQRSDRGIRRLYDTIKRDAERTDINIDFYRGPSNHNVRKLINIIMTYTQEHPSVSYTQGMTDMLSPLLYVMKDEADSYICFSCLLQPIQENFNPQCEGALEKIEVLKHLCEVLAPDLYHYLQELDQDAFTLCFGMVLIECRREFSFKDSINLLEVIIASRYGYRTMVHNVSQVIWANYMTTISMDILEEIIVTGGSSSSIARSVNSDYAEESYAGRVSNPISPASCTSQPRDITGYHVTRSSTLTPQLNAGRRSHDPSVESRPSTRGVEISHSMGNTPVPPESGVDSSSEGNLLVCYPAGRQRISSSDDNVISIRFFDNPQETALELSSGHTSRASSLQPSGRMDYIAHDITNTKFDLSFPLFISLAMLLTHRWRILHEKIDFIGISGLLSDNIGSLELQRCLEKAKWLKQHYHYLQQERFGFKRDSFSRWLTEDINGPHHHI